MSNKGNLRSYNEDNYYFDGYCMERGAQGNLVPVTLRTPLPDTCVFAVFDGMGGEAFGDEASYAAAEAMCRQQMPHGSIREETVLRLVETVNHAVVRRSQELCASRMGCTLALLCLSHGNIYACNVGDSRIYCLRGGQLLRLSEDDTDTSPMNRGRKPPLKQCLGIDPAEMQIEPHIKSAAFAREDWYLLCSDGLTDMVTETQIRAIMRSSINAAACTEALYDAALEQGGRDNITALVCKID